MGNRWTVPVWYRHPDNYNTVYCLFPLTAPTNTINNQTTCNKA